jgi:hypothetical protein
MEGLSGPLTHLDLLAAQPAPDKKQRANRSRKGSDRVLPKNDSDAEGSFASLVSRDGLYFRVLSDPARHKMSPSQAGGPGSRNEGIWQAFRRPFNEVWDRVPRPDRQVFVDYWQRPPYRSASDGLSFTPPPSGHRPLIQVTDRAPLSPLLPVWSQLGHEMNFPVALVVEQPHRLPLVIARTLAQVFMLATRRHWRLVVSKIEEPLARWERSQGARVTEAARDERLDVLEAEYLRAHEAEVAQVLRRWGLQGP